MSLGHLQSLVPSIQSESSRSEMQELIVNIFSGLFRYEGQFDMNVFLNWLVCQSMSGLVWCIAIVANRTGSPFSCFIPVSGLLDKLQPLVY